MVLNVDEHFDVTTDVSAELVYDAESRQKLDVTENRRNVDGVDKNDVGSTFNVEGNDFDDEE
jgi:hypothetical protein